MLSDAHCCYSQERLFVFCSPQKVPVISSLQGLKRVSTSQDQGKGRHQHTFCKWLGHQVLDDRMIILNDQRPIFDSEDFVLDEIRPWMINCLRKQTCYHTRHFTVMGPNSMSVALAQLHHNLPKAFWL